MKLGLLFGAGYLTTLLCFTSACGWWSAAKTVDVLTIVACVLTESARVAPNRMPTAPAGSFPTSLPTHTPNTWRS